MPVFQQRRALIDTVDILVRVALPDYALKQSSLLFQLEARYTLFRLRHILDSSNNESILPALINFLSTRWSLIKNTDAQYCCDFDSPANTMCIKIAVLLHNLGFGSSLALLMPTLKTVHVSNYVTADYSDESLNLKYLMLNDDNTRLIHIVDVLDFAQNDGILKHNSLFSRQKKKLSVRESERLLQKHPTVKNYFDSIQDKVYFETEGGTAGAYLKRLINGLANGDKKHTGSEEIAGDCAFVAIAEFANYLDFLLINDKNMRKKIMDMGTNFDTNSTTREYCTIRRCWERLRHKKIRKNSLGIGLYCVELISQDLQAILDDNPILYQMTAYNADEKITLDAIHNCVKLERDIMVRSLDETPHASSLYSSEYLETLLVNLIKKIAKNDGFKLTSQEICCIAEYYSSAKDYIAEDKQTPFNQDCRTILSLAKRNSIKKIWDEALQMMTPLTANKVLMSHVECASTLFANNKARPRILPDTVHSVQLGTRL